MSGVKSVTPGPLGSDYSRQILSAKLSAPRDFRGRPRRPGSARGARRPGLCCKQQSKSQASPSRPPFLCPSLSTVGEYALREIVRCVHARSVCVAQRRASVGILTNGDYEDVFAMLAAGQPREMAPRSYADPQIQARTRARCPRPTSSRGMVRVRPTLPKRFCFDC